MGQIRRRPDRAQRERTRRQWWDRHGAFARGVMTGLILAALLMWLLKTVRGL